MTATAQVNGWSVHWHNGRWVFSDTMEPIDSRRPCRSCSRHALRVSVGARSACVDACIAPIVEALNAAGVRTTSSCCGHGLKPGFIKLATRRECMECICTRLNRPQGQRQAGPPPVRRRVFAYHAEVLSEALECGPDYAERLAFGLLFLTGGENG